MKKTVVINSDFKCVNYDNSACFLGSCFSEHLFRKMKKTGFKANANPFGVIFNPLSISDFLFNLNGNWKESIVKRSDLFFSWKANSNVYGESAEKLNQTLEKLSVNFKEDLSKSSVLFITFGTAWIYRLKESNEVVANCHKFPASSFTKELLSIEEITKEWNLLLKKISKDYPNLKIVFTLSPVRHIKDGLIENARSKAILLESIHQVIDNNSQAFYFPAFEIIMDEFRDYGFYGKDGIHPNEIAIDEIWERFKLTFMSLDTQRIIIEFLKIRNAFEHKLIHPNSVDSKQFIKERESKLADFIKKNSNVIYDFLE
ncbi:MAG: GSCFA domain-containing protein [Brumimicrobium sp.]